MASDLEKLHDESITIYDRLIALETADKQTQEGNAERLRFLRAAIEQLEMYMDKLPVE